MPDHGPAPDGALRDLAEDPVSRKRFLRRLGGTGAAATGLAVLIAACGEDEETTGSSGETTRERGRTSGGGSEAGDLEIVNYALTLEYLEADFYRQVIDSGEVKDRTLAEIAKVLGDHEQQHVEALTATVEQLGGTPAEKPRTKFEEVIAGGQDMIIATAATVENLGAAAYLGQAGRIKSPEILAAALSIHSVEARHAAALNAAAGRDFTGDGQLEGSIPDGAFSKPLSMDEVLEQVKPFIAS